MADQSSARDDHHLALRMRLREQRRRLPDGYRHIAQRETRTRLGKLGPILRAQHLAVYLSVDGELSLEAVISDAKSRNKVLYAPFLSGDSMHFARFHNNADLRPNRLGILEPKNRDSVSPQYLDVVLAPLVAFDERGTRLGMGGGYYDRCFKFLCSRRHWTRPKLIGIGYEFQRIQNIERRSWDIPLWAAVTEKGIYRF